MSAVDASGLAGEISCSEFPNSSSGRGSMTVMPTWEGFMAPVLRLLSDGEVRKLRDIYRSVADAERMTSEQAAELLPSGQTRISNRVGWACSYLNRVGALSRPQRGFYEITAIGKKLLASHPSGIVEADLKAFASPNDHWWAASPSKSIEVESVDDATRLDPVEQVDQGIARINADVAADLLARLMGQRPEFFEQAVVDLLLAMGYGGAYGRGEITSLTNDGGIDGVIDQDALGLNKVYVQAKRYAATHPVQRPEVQGFVGALSGKAEGGLFFTTGQFTRGAKEYAAAVPSRIVLVDGEELANLMIKYEVGVQVQGTRKLVEVDEDFFE